MEYRPLVADVSVDEVQRIHLLVRDLIRWGVIYRVMSLTLLQNSEPPTIPDPFILHIQIFDQTTFPDELIFSALSNLTLVYRLDFFDRNV